MSPPPPPSKKIKKRSSFNANVDDQQREDDHPSISSLPDEIVLSCLLHVPRSYYLNLSCVSKTLRSLVRSPELCRLRSLHHKDSVYVSFRENDYSDTTYHWFTLCRSEKKTEYRLVSVPIPFPSQPFMHQASTVAVGSEIFFVGGSFKPSSDLWILDTRSGKLTQGPSMKAARTCETAVGVINGRIYVIGGCEEEIQVEVFDPKLRSWKVAESPEERLRCRSLIRLSASLDQKLYMVDFGGMVVYDTRKGRRRMETLEIPSDTVWFMCVVGDVLYAYYFMRGLMWFDAKVKVWRSVVGCGVNALDDAKFYAAVTAEYDGKLAIMWPEKERVWENEKKEIRFALIALDFVGKEIRGTIEWSGIVATMPDSYNLDHCLNASH